MSEIERVLRTNYRATWSVGNLARPPYEYTVENIYEVMSAMILDGKLTRVGKRPQHWWEGTYKVTNPAYHIPVQGRMDF